MNTIRKFEMFKSSVFNAQDILKNHFLKPNPIIYTSDTSDYSQATVYKDIAEYVWLINPKITLEKDFPLWAKPPIGQNSVAYEFPYVNKESHSVKSWDMVKLVPSTGLVDTVERKSVICGVYDIYRGKSQFDIFFLGSEEDDLYKNLKNKYSLKTIKNIKDAWECSETDMFWIVPKNIKVKDDFNFDLVPHERAYEYPHVFGNGEIDNHSGIVLMSKYYIPTDKELEYNFYVKKRIIKRIISAPA